jgi:rubredoxin
MDIQALYKLSYGLYVVSSLDENRPVGCIANSVMQVTAVPETVAVSIHHDNYTTSCIEKSGMFAVSILHEKSDPEIIKTFGFTSSKDKDKFKNFDYSYHSNMPVINDSVGYIVCKVINKMQSPTHTVFLGQVVDCNFIKKGQPVMTYDYYYNVIRGTSPKNAPTYSAASTKKGKYVCKICGYVYDGAIPFEQLPDDYICPICKHPKSDFELIK